jgi:hypothetical protein
MITHYFDLSDKYSLFNSRNSGFGEGIDMLFLKHAKILSIHYRNNFIATTTKKVKFCLDFKEIKNLG